MKPRIKLESWGGGHWICKLRGTRTAIGDTPQSAYRNWRFINGAWMGRVGS